MTRYSIHSLLPYIRKSRRTAYAIACSGTGIVKEIREILKIESNQFSPYRKCLIQKGIISGEEYGHVRFALPLFEVFVKNITMKRSDCMSGRRPFHTGTKYRTQYSQYEAAKGLDGKYRAETEYRTPC